MTYSSSNNHGLPQKTKPKKKRRKFDTNTPSWWHAPIVVHLPNWSISFPCPEMSVVVHQNSSTIGMKGSSLHMTSNEVHPYPCHLSHWWIIGGPSLSSLMGLPQMVPQPGFPVRKTILLTIYKHRIQSTEFGYRNTGWEQFNRVAPNCRSQGLNPTFPSVYNNQTQSPP
jgi:hypothetical protein